MRLGLRRFGLCGFLGCDGCAGLLLCGFAGFWGLGLCGLGLGLCGFGGGLGSAPSCALAVAKATFTVLPFGWSLYGLVRAALSATMPRPLSSSAVRVP